MRNKAEFVLLLDGKEGTSLYRTKSALADLGKFETVGKLRLTEQCKSQSQLPFFWFVYLNYNFLGI